MRTVKLKNLIFSLNLRRLAVKRIDPALLVEAENYNASKDAFLKEESTQESSQANKLRISKLTFFVR